MVHVHITDGHIKLCTKMNGIMHTYTYVRMYLSIRTYICTHVCTYTKRMMLPDIGGEASFNVLPNMTCLRAYNAVLSPVRLVSHCSVDTERQVLCLAPSHPLSLSPGLPL